MTNSRRGGARLGTGPKKRLMPRISIADFQVLIANQQALLNIAESKAPILCDDPQWVGLRAQLEESARKLGAKKWEEKTGEKYRQVTEE